MFADRFTALVDAIDLDTAVALVALAKMRARFRRPELSPEALLLRYESQGFIYTADLLRPYAAQL